MHYTQNDKIRQATEGTIVLGVDIGSEKNYLRAFGPNGIEITKKAISFLNTLEGFKSFGKIVTNMTVPLAGKKIIVGVEPTGLFPPIRIRMKTARQGNLGRRRRESKPLQMGEFPSAAGG